MSANSSTPNIPRPLQLVDGNVPSPRLTSPPAIDSPRGSCPTPLSPAASTPTSSRRPASQNPRRQSSISYFPSDHTRVLDLRSPSSSSSFSFTATVRRSNSLGVKRGESVNSVSRVRGDRRSLGLENLNGGTTVERPPLTLTEKHADLLSFIAQKEAKCLELRSQLAIHEAELNQLKRKWERIVSRGMDRAYSTPPSSATSQSSKPASSAPSSVLPTPLLSSSNGAVLDGIKEGVHEVGRFLAGGLSSTSTSEVLPGFAGVSRASMTPALRRASHFNTQSISSVSTAETSSTSKSGSSVQRLSQSSQSSLSCIEDEGVSYSDEDETNRQGGVMSPVTANISLSPTSELPSSKLLRRRSREVPKSPLSPITSPTLDSKKEASVKRTNVGLPPPAVSGVSSLSMFGSVGSSVGKKWEEIQKGETFLKSQKRASLLLSDVSQSIFAALASPSTPSTPNSAPASRSCSARHSSTPSISISSNPFLATLSPISPMVSPSALSTSRTGSLLDDDELEGDTDVQSGRKGLGEVMVPSVVFAAKGSGGSEEKEKRSLLDDDDDNWNCFSFLSISS
ncbi:unnamed protein product [Somion occarium]|uniref:Uncharacterized protein n=1 Tax=Somion occarium TaxID=3059160 RepID=A0ABP1DMH0_9APHY